MRWFDRSSLSRQFMLASFPVLLAGMVVIGLWVQREVERGIVSRLSEVQSLYVDSLVAPFQTELVADGVLDERRRAGLDALFADTPLGRRIVAFILWRPDGRVLYSNETQLIGRSFPVGEGLRTALSGKVHAKVIDRGTQSHLYAAPDWPERLFETYAPIHAGPFGTVVGVAEFYQDTEELDQAMREARRRTWGVVAITTLAMYVLLFGLVRRGSETILAQREELRARVEELDRLARTNADLAAKVKRAAARTTASNEVFLRRVAADLHDGPAQDFGFAQMRVGSILEVSQPGESALVARSDLDAVRSALELGMTDLRAICAGLQLPDLADLSMSEVVARVVRDYERKTGATVTVEVGGELGEVALPIRITVFRVLQETLANGFRHAGGALQRVALRRENDEIHVEVADRGPGLDEAAVSALTQGGLAGMRERVQALGGVLQVASVRGEGTRVRVRLPAQLTDAVDD
jgi:signal transduction histidine kinase